MRTILLLAVSFLTGLKIFTTTRQSRLAVHYPIWQPICQRMHSVHALFAVVLVPVLLIPALAVRCHRRATLAAHGYRNGQAQEPAQGFQLLRQIVATASRRADKEQGSRPSGRRWRLSPARPIGRRGPWRTSSCARLQRTVTRLSRMRRMRRMVRKPCDQAASATCSGATASARASISISCALSMPAWSA